MDVPLIVIAEFVRLELPMLVRVLLAPLMVLFVRVWLPVKVATVESIAIVPEVVIVPPVKPVPAVMLVTVPPELGLVLVTVKFRVSTRNANSSTTCNRYGLVGAVLVTVTAPVEPLTLIPVPATAEVTPVLVIVKLG